MAETVGSEERRPVASVSLLGWSLRVSAVIGLVAVAGAAQLARWNASGAPSPRGPARVLAGATPADPETTGTITRPGAAQAARTTRLDPCLLPAAAQLRP